MHSAGPAYWWDISEDERCAFAKLYCPEMVGIVESTRERLVSGVNRVCFELPTLLPVTLELYTLEGRRVSSRHLVPEGEYLCEDFSTEGLARGIYVVQLLQGASLQRTLLLLVP